MKVREVTLSRAQFATIAALLEAHDDDGPLYQGDSIYVAPVHVGYGIVSVRLARRDRYADGGPYETLLMTKDGTVIPR